MNKIERMVGIILLLGNRDRLTAKDLAEIFEVSKRTIYRDVQALSELQVPIVAEKGLDGGYSILDDYFIKPVMLSEEEVEAIYLGCNFLSEQEQFPLSHAARMAMEKLSAILSLELKDRGQEILKSISFNLLSNQIARDCSDVLFRVKFAVDQKKTIEIEYRGLNGTTKRKVDPYELVCENNAWYFRGFCQLRQEIRQFKLVRIVELKITNDSFNHKNVNQSKVVEQSEEVVVKIRKASSLYINLKEHQVYKSLIDVEDGERLYLRFPRKEYSNPYLFRIILSFGDQAEILEPDSIRDEFITATKNILKNYIS